MPLPSAWVDRLFAKLAVTYGQRFLGLYSGLDLEAVKADWADELDGLQARPEAIRHALEHLPPDHPPTVLQFRALCRNAPQAAPLAALDSPRAKPAPGLLQHTRRALAARGGNGRDAALRLAQREAWQQAHPGEVDPHDKLSERQREFWRQVLNLPKTAKAADVLSELAEGAAA